jgi:hypothetical protein
MNLENPFGRSSAHLDIGVLKELEQTTPVPVYFHGQTLAMLEHTAP